MSLKIEVLNDIRPQLDRVDAISEFNTRKVLDAMRECRVSLAHFAPTTGYAYGDIGREKLDEVYAKIFRAECGEEAKFPMYARKPADYSLFIKAEPELLQRSID